MTGIRQCSGEEEEKWASHPPPWPAVALTNQALIRPYTYPNHGKLEGRAI